MIDRRKFLGLAAAGGGLALAPGCGASRGVDPSEAATAERRHLAQLHEAMLRDVEQRLAPGIITLIAHRGRPRIDMIGTMAFGGAPMRRDSIFRIASMTKPITGVATMILVEDGKLTLDEPVERLLPELANRRVLKRLDGPLDDTVPATRPITLRDLLTFRWGHGMIFTPNNYPIVAAETALELATQPVPVMPLPRAPFGPDEWMRRLGTLPLKFQPGAQWMYNTGAQVLSVLVARASRMPFEDFLRERLFGPLAMTNTSFSVPAHKLDRLTTGYAPNPTTHALEVFDAPDHSQWSTPPLFPDGSGGLVSTVDDFFAFAQMMLDDGKYRGRRILSRDSIRAMTTNYVTPEQRQAGADFVLGPDRGWGFCTAVATGDGAAALPPPGFGWDGGYGPSFTSDPETGRVSILLSQRSEFPAQSKIYQDFWAAVHAMTTQADSTSSPGVRLR